MAPLILNACYFVPEGGSEIEPKGENEEQVKAFLALYANAIALVSPRRPHHAAIRMLACARRLCQALQAP